MPKLVSAKVFTQDPSRLQYMASTFDGWSRRRLVDLGLAEGWQVLEVGAGFGAVAVWMADRVGPGGHVTATDLDVSLVPLHPRLHRLRHDLLNDPLPPGTYDLIYARLTLGLMPHRWGIVQKLSRSLRPGGWLLVEEFAGHEQPYVLCAPDTDTYRIMSEYHRALSAVLDRSGKGVEWEIPAAMVEAGLERVDAQLWTRSWQGGTPGCQLILSTLFQLRTQMIDAGMSPTDHDRAMELMTDRELIIYMHLLESVAARRPVD